MPIKKTKKDNSFTKALSQAARRYSQALKEREACQKQLASLNTEIPALQETIRVLQRQIEPNAVVFKNSKTGQETAPSGKIVVPALPSEMTVKIDGVEQKIPLPVQDLSGMGSVPASVVDMTPGRELTEDELLDAGDVK